jgi:hypothetical protein
VRPYDAAKGPAIYRDRQWPKPAGPPLKMTFEQADAIPPYIELPERRGFQAGTITTTVGPGYLTRDQIIVLSMIRDAFPERPLYFSAGGYAQQLGLGEYVLTQGMAQRLMPTPVATTADTPATPGGHLDLARSYALWTTVFRGPEALRRQGRWVDRASVDIPLAYAVNGMVLANALQQAGKTAEANRVADTVNQLAAAADLREYFGGLPSVGAPSGGGDQ